MNEIQNSKKIQLFLERDYYMCVDGVWVYSHANLYTRLA